MASGGERAEAPDDPDDEAPLQRARKALVSNAAARRWRAETAAQRQRDYLGELARPGGLRAAVEAIEDSLQGLMDVCTEAVMNGFAVMNMKGSSVVLFWSQKVEDAHAFEKAHPECDPLTLPMTLREAMDQRAERVQFAMPLPAQPPLMRSADVIRREIADAEARLAELNAQLLEAA